MLIDRGLFLFLSQSLRISSVKEFNTVVHACANLLSEKDDFKIDLVETNLYKDIFTSFEKRKDDCDSREAIAWLISNSLKNPPYLKSDLVG